MAAKKGSPSGRRDSFTDLTKKLKCEVQGLEGGINNLFRKGVSVLNKKLYSSVPTSKNLQDVSFRGSMSDVGHVNDDEYKKEGDNSPFQQTSTPIEGLSEEEKLAIFQRGRSHSGQNQLYDILNDTLTPQGNANESVCDGSQEKLSGPVEFVCSPIKFDNNL